MLNLTKSYFSIIEKSINEQKEHIQTISIQNTRV
jgi:hypothetical protein